MEKENKKDEKKVEEKKVKKSIFEKLEEQKQKLEKLKIKKDNEIKKIILKSFDFLTEEETLKRFSQLSENEVFLEKIKDTILKEMEEEEKSKEEEKRKEEKQNKKTFVEPVSTQGNEV